MDYSKITDEKVRSAIQAFQSADVAWYDYFTDAPQMTDDGRRVDFRAFFQRSLGKERFISIDKVENEGKDIYGNFKAGSLGTFKVFFKFRVNAEGSFDRLDIGQASY